MIILSNRHALELAACLAVMLHLLLFLMVRPASPNGLVGAPVLPNTHYLAKAPGALPVTGVDARVVWSPLMFSKPSKMGFSRSFLQDDLQTRLTFDRKVESEYFLVVEPRSSGGAQVDAQALMLTASENTAPQLPASEFLPEGKQPAARRVYVVPELKERLVGGIVLPPELNKEVESAWEVHADITVSGQGIVQHIFLEQPLESTELNSQILRLLQGLRFKPGDTPVDGRIEIYSPKTSGEGVVEP